MRNLLGLLIALICLAAISPAAHAAKQTKASKAAQPSKERLVMMPLRLPEEDKSLQGMMEAALVEGLQQKYTVLWGEEVEKKAREIYRKENLKHECNEERCMQGITEAFQSELLATANITKQDGGYFLSLTIQNLYDHVVIYTKSIPCEGCTAFKVVDKLKELSGAPAQIAAAPAAEAPQPKVNPNDPDDALWSEAQKGNTVDDYQVYLDSYPKGKYVPFAKARIKKLNEAAQAAAEQQEQQSWDAAQKDSSEASYRLYLKGYPTGRFAGLARMRSDKLKEEAANEGARKEQQAWQAAEQAGDEAGYLGYLKTYPQGSYAGLAQVKIRKLQTGQSARKEEEQALWNKAQIEGNAKSIKDYLDKYPNGTYAAAAQENLASFRKEAEAEAQTARNQLEKLQKYDSGNPGEISPRQMRAAEDRYKQSVRALNEINGKIQPSSTK